MFFMLGCRLVVETRCASRIGNSEAGLRRFLLAHCHAKNSHCES